MNAMEQYIMNAIEEGTNLLKDSDYIVEYRKKVNKAMQLLLEAMNLINVDD